MESHRIRKSLVALLFGAVLLVIAPVQVHAAITDPVSPLQLTSLDDPSFEITNDDGESFQEGWVFFEGSEDGYCSADSFYGGGTYGDHTLQGWLDLVGNCGNPPDGLFHLVSVPNGDCRTGTYDDCVTGGTIVTDICIESNSGGQCGAPPVVPTSTADTSGTGSLTVTALAILLFIVVGVLGYFLSGGLDK